jgi:hypothetical protein
MRVRKGEHAERLPEPRSRYVACYFENDSARYSAIGHGWIIRTPDYVGSCGHSSIGDAVRDCMAWERTGFKPSEGYVPIA